MMIVTIATLLQACGIERVDEGYRGVKKVWGKVEGEALGPGLYFYNPFSTDIFEMAVLEEKL
jgi:regulator of protease activity HflC (stomatin/prohibitin superfamily)